MNKVQLNKLVNESVAEIISEYNIPENLQLGGNLKQEISNFAERLISSGVLSSYHRKLTSGDMQAKDFKEDLVHKLLSAIRDWTKNVNDRSDWENDEGGMIK